MCFKFFINLRGILFLRIFLFLALVLICWSPREGYCRKATFKYCLNYYPKDYINQPQNWCILQDKRGIIYVANQGAVMEFDGVSWREIPVPNKSVRSLAMDDKGIIYVGGINEIGFLAPDAIGKLCYESLLDFLDDDKRNFSLVWQTHSTTEGIYFRTSKFLFHWNQASKQFKVWEAKYRFNSSFVCEGKFVIQQKNVGLMHIVNDSLTLIPGSETFAANEKIYVMVPYDSKRMLMGTRAKGIYIFDGIKAVPFPTGIDNYLKEKRLSYGIRLSSPYTKSGNFALGTFKGGLVIIDSQGNLKQILNKASGLQDDNVKYVLEDSLGNLWLALDKGISKIEYASPISVLDDRSGLTGIVLSVVRHEPDNALYVGTTRGLYYLEGSSTSFSKFRPVPGLTTTCWSLLCIGDYILAVTTYGVFQVEVGNDIKRRIINNPSYTLLQSKLEPKRIWVGTNQGLGSLYLENEKNQWNEEFQFKAITGSIRTIVEDKKGNLWLGTLTKGVLQVDFPNGMIHPIVTRYNTSHQLPPGEVHVFKAAGHPIFATDKGIFRFDEERKVFLPDYTLGEKFAGGEKGKGVFRILEDQKKNIWFHSKTRNFQAVPKPGGVFAVISSPVLAVPRTQVNAIYPDPDGYTIWFAHRDGLISYDTTAKYNYNIDFQTLIRAVVVNGKPVFNGYKINDASKIFFPIIAYKDRNLRFEFTAPFFQGESETQYQCYLDGYDSHWSRWTIETRKDYTNLDSGLYTFRVRSKNVYENLGEEDVFQFRILPPWYKTWWAFLIYGLTALFLMFLVVKWRSWKLEQEKLKLEHIIKQRTKEIDDKNRQLQRKTLQLEEQSEKLKEMDKVKSRFFANISHEFRTPLTLIMGPLEQILSDKPGKEMEAKANLMLRNSRRLLNLINQLLELAKFESGKVQLEASPQDIVPLVKNIVMCFESLAMQKKVELIFKGQAEHIPVYFDPEKLENIITNLLSNAFNYLSAGGKITVSVRSVAGTDSFPFGCVEISVRDTGPGIPKDQLPHIFERFYRGKGNHGSDRKGTGIGLALCKDLVELHHGEIQVQSSCRDDHTCGTEFIIRLPTGKEHLQPGEIVDRGDTGQLPVFQEPSKPSLEKKLNKSFCGGGQGGQFFQKAPPLAAGGKIKEEQPIVLVVEDNPIERLFIKVTLENQFNVIEAADGKEGILRAKEIIPDLIVSDIIMPVIDGYELCRTLKQDVLTSHIPIILLTVKGSEESVLQGLETGADDYITKPFSKSLLVARAGNLLELRRQLQLERKNRMMLQPEKITVSPMDDEFYKKLQDTVETHLSDPDFNVEALSRVLQMSQATLYRKIHGLTGKTPTSFIRSYRIKRAAQLLEAQAGNVSEIADKVGFLDKSYFARCFKEQFHCSPSDIQSSEVSGTINEGGETEDRGQTTDDREQVTVETTSNEKLLRGTESVEQWVSESVGQLDSSTISKRSNEFLMMTRPQGETKKNQHQRFAQHMGSPRRGAPGRRGQEIILLVEDSEDARHFIRESLEPEYRVVEAVDGGEGIARAVEIVPDLIISDIMMPEVDGYELCRVLKRDVRTSHIPIILLTAKASEEDMIRGLETGADDYITKPFNTKILQVRIRNLIGLRSHLQKNRNREMALLPGKISESEIDREFMKELGAVIKKNISDPEFNVDMLAKKLYMSRLTLYRKILAISGETPTEFIRSHRLKRGAQLLESNFGSVLEVAFEVGFSNSSYFAKCFKEAFHQSPSDYQVSKAK
jgi:DNA-binding response OmpR family regulator/signal transduction histidine kinase